MSEQSSGATTSEGADKCEVNMGLIHLQAGDLVSAYRYFLGSAEAGDLAAIRQLVEICERGGDPVRAKSWRRRLSTSNPAD